MDHKATLHRYLQARRGELIGKLDGLGEYDIRRPLTPTGTNLLGLVKHVASVQSEYFGLVFGRPSGIDLPWYTDGDDPPDGDMWVTADESRDDIVSLYERSAAHSDETIELLPADAPGEVPWWPAERRAVTLHQVLVHMCGETARHAGHADIVREMIDGSIGTRLADPNVPQRSEADWLSYRNRIEDAARAAAGRP